MNDINLSLHCLLLLLLFSREVLGVESSFIYAPHPVTQILKTGLRCPRVWSLWKPGHICERLRHISMQDVKLALQPFCISLRFMLGILWICLNVKISLYTFFLC